MNPQPILAAIDPGTLLVATVLLVMVSAMVTVLRQYKRCPAGKVMVLLGKLPNGKAAMCIRSGGVFVWPLIQDVMYLSLHPMRVQTPIFEAVGRQNQKVQLSVTAGVAISTDPAVMDNAAERLLGLDERSIIAQVNDIVIGQTRRLIASLDADSLRAGHAIAEQLRPPLDETLNQLGLHTIALDVRMADVQNAPAPAACFGGASVSNTCNGAADCGGDL